jgi:hypothetical protein
VHVGTVPTQWQSVYEELSAQSTGLSLVEQTSGQVFFLHGGGEKGLPPPSELGAQEDSHLSSSQTSGFTNLRRRQTYPPLSWLPCLTVVMNA